jgi:acetylornithine/succinyldiaminopimelate/putrescine aminotransferase
MSDTRERIIDLYARHVSPGKVDVYRKYDIALVPGKRGGCCIHDVNGREFINCHSNGGVFNLGHRNPRVMKAVTAAMKTYDIGNHHLISAPKARCAALLAETMPKGLNQVVFGVSGGEAIDLAIKFARGVTGRYGIVSAQGGYHGHTGLAMMTGDAKFRDKFGPVPPGFSQVPFNDAGAIESAVSDTTAAVILETIPATMGIVVPDKGYFKAVAKICRDRGAHLIMDEVQTGFGRTGKMWGFQHFGVEPDIVVLGKGMSGGIYPVSATVYHEKHAGFFREDPFIHISTYGGSEIGCFAALEVIKISRTKAFLGRVDTMGKFFRKEFEALGRRYPKLGLKTRGLGLMMGLEFRDEMTALFLVKLLFDNGVYLVYSGNDPKVLQFLPPLVVTTAVARRILKAAEKAFRALG